MAGDQTVGHAATDISTSTAMPELTITLSEELSLRLVAEAERLGVQPPELVRTILETSVQRLSDDFLVAARYVLDKNKELYERLS